MRGSRPLSAEEVAAVARELSRSATGRRDKALFLLGVNTGFRVSELLSLRVGDLVDEAGRLASRVTVRRRDMKGGRSGRSSSRTVKLNHAAREALSPWLVELREAGFIHRDDPLFPGRGGQRLGRVQAWRILTRAYCACGLAGRLGTHAMRKTFANRVYRWFLDQVAAGMAVDAFRATSKALGHADIKSTDQYLSFLTEEIDAAVEAIGG